MKAGFFEHGKSRLLMPAFAVKEDAPTPPADEKLERKKNGGGGGDFGDHDPLIAGRLKWLQTAANIFDLLYKGDGGGIVVSTAR